MTVINVQSAKLSLVFPAGRLPKIDPNSPLFTIALGGFNIACSVTAKAARKLAEHPGGAVLQGKLVVEQGQLGLVEAGFQLLPPAETEAPAADSEAGKSE
jgi:hypothetical protein